MGDTNADPVQPELVEVLEVPKIPKIIITCQHNKHKNSTDGDVRGAEVSGMLGVALSDAIHAKAGLTKGEARFVKVLYAPNSDVVEKCTLGSYIIPRGKDDEHQCNYREDGQSIREKLEVFVNGYIDEDDQRVESKDEVCWIIDLHTFIADPDSPTEKGWLDYVYETVFMHPAVITPLDNAVDDILRDVHHLTEEDKNIYEWIITKKHNCILDQFSGGIKCVLMNFAVTRDENKEADMWLKGNVDAITDTLAASFITEPAFIKFKETLTGPSK